MKLMGFNTELDKFIKKWIYIVAGFGPAFVCLKKPECVTNGIIQADGNGWYFRFCWEYVTLFGDLAQPKDNIPGSLKNDTVALRSCLVQELLSTCNPSSDCISEVVGSTTDVSDIDVNLHSPSASKVLGEINKRGYDLLQQPLGETDISLLFDINFYGSSFTKILDPKNQAQFQGNSNITTLSVTRNNVGVTLYWVTIPAGEFNQFQRNNRAWAYVHFLSCIGDLDTFMSNKYTNVFKDSAIFQDARNMFKALQQEKTNGCGAVACIASHMNKAEEMFKQIIEPPSEGKSDLALEYYNELSTIQFFANETYFSRGAYMHIVNPDVQMLSVDDYISSAIDNLAFIAELYNHYVKNLVCDDNEQYNKHVLGRVGKYVERVCDALMLGLQVRFRENKRRTITDETITDNIIAQGTNSINNVKQELEQLKAIASETNILRKKKSLTNENVQQYNTEEDFLFKMCVLVRDLTGMLSSELTPPHPSTPYNPTIPGGRPPKRASRRRG
jgi:hypothetical protein